MANAFIFISLVIFFRKNTFDNLYGEFENLKCS